MADQPAPLPSPTPESEPPPVALPVSALTEAAREIVVAAGSQEGRALSPEHARAIDEAADALLKAAKALRAISRAAGSPDSAPVTSASGTEFGPEPQVDELPPPEPEPELDRETLRERRRLRASEMPDVDAGAGDFVPEQPMSPPWLIRFFPAGDLFSPREEIIRSMKIYQRFKWISVLLALGLLVGVFARPASRWLRGYQAARLAREALALMDAGKWNEAVTPAVDAYSLWPAEPLAMRAAARALTRENDARALEIWEQLRGRGEMQPDDWRAWIGLASAKGKLDLADKLLGEFIPQVKGGTIKDRTAGMWLAALRGDRRRAGELGRALLKDPVATDENRVEVAALLADQTEPEFAADGWAELEKQARKPGEVGLAALLRVARRSGAPNRPAAECEEWVSLLKGNPRVTAPAFLLALDLESARLGAPAERVVGDAVAKLGRAEDEPTVLALCRWLLARREFERVLDILPIDRAATFRSFALVHVEALQGLERWNDIRQILSRQQLPIDGGQADLQLAIALTHLNEATAAANRWKKLMSAASGDAKPLTALAEIAEQHGARDIAEAAYRDVVKLSPQTRPAWEGLVRVLDFARDTPRTFEVLTEMRRAFPDDLRVQSDWAYLAALLVRELDEAARLAQSAVTATPQAVVPRLSLALVKVRQKRFDEALAALAGTPLEAPSKLSGGSFTPSQIVVAAAVYAVSGHLPEAKTLVTGLEKANLRREEREIANRILAAETGPDGK